MIMENVATGVRRKVLGGMHRLWAFLFGFIYYACKGTWGWAVISFITFNGAFILLPLWNRTIIQRSYENQGWRVVRN